MTTKDDLQQAVSAAEGLKTQLETFAQDTNDQEAAQMFKGLAQNLDNCTQQLNGRFDYVKQEEPQYQGQ
ncbi:MULTISPECIES: DUF1657 domain-containing protein [unclassified Candidatus Frackibacter]|uniref:DUF1657 domain-containing protein n=1 Tax=unclassified Candidatus Frackibacter TaxID=2648818 RepID=UPI0008854038|nr:MULTISPECIES: DUF1657 domain-containing protein [unclassified Candidatus Frackibacter]SDC81044.1 Protein of unknown function [Candidatus Frackibacter sp. WG11]SEM93453.1 Protein of unknown function [Candidatus Frackibacter sp. WG12]SFM02430.1 Protein of unknown function [Candidatus Frackibacter sp. WG13]